MGLIKTHIGGGRLRMNQYFMEPWQSTYPCEPEAWTEELVQRIDESVTFGHGLEYRGEVGQPPDEVMTPINHYITNATHVAALKEARDSSEFSPGASSVRNMHSAAPGTPVELL